jgi:predicted PhzF superfamily epimerase YddE/YHI9
LFASGVVSGGYIAAQGRCRGRNGRVHITHDESGRIWVGGNTRTQVEGRLQGIGTA